ncbi:hypothetical protein [Pelagibius sp. Alg239-R121]|uniref:hypothetical protein n=1 Tax=Pelagibius sp. Alg239-R121 TaxID=2993448 RepID=UPI0024A6D8B9|nr:hypothetical protein [Pelagibius sp. Alg239-R121]
MSNQWLWLTVPVGLISLIILPIFIWRLVEVHRTQLVLSVPLLVEQEIAIDTVGSLVLHAEGPRFTRAFGGLDYQLTDLSDQSAVPLNRTIVPFTSSGISRSRLSLGAFEIERPGRFRLTVTGITDPTVADENNLVVTHDKRGGTIVTILIVVFSAIGLLGGLTLSAIIYFGNR